MKQSIKLLAIISILGITSCCVKPNSNKEVANSNQADKEVNESVKIKKKKTTLDSSKKDVKKKNEELVWYTDFEEARKISTNENKPIFAFFTGSDWCGWCIRLQNNVFSKDAFKEWANEEVVLLELDFPRRSKLPEALRQQNYELAGLLKVRGYPTVWFLNTSFNKDTKKVEIAPLGSTGYPSGAVAGKEEVKFISDANRILANQ